MYNCLERVYTKAKVYNLLRKPKELTSTEKIEAAIVDFIDEGKFSEITVAEITSLDGVIAYKDYLKELGGDFANLDANLIFTFLLINKTSCYLVALFYRITGG